MDAFDDLGQTVYNSLSLRSLVKGFAVTVSVGGAFLLVAWARANSQELWEALVGQIPVLSFAGPVALGVVLAFIAKQRMWLGQLVRSWKQLGATDDKGLTPAEQHAEREYLGPTLKSAEADALRARVRATTDAKSAAGGLQARVPAARAESRPQAVLTPDRPTGRASPPQTVPPSLPSLCDVVLLPLDPTDRSTYLRVLRALRDLDPSRTVVEATALLASAPVCVQTRKSVTEAEAASATLVQAGARVVVTDTQNPLPPARLADESSEIQQSYRTLWGEDAAWRWAVDRGLVGRPVPPQAAPYVRPERAYVERPLTPAMRAYLHGEASWQPVLVTAALVAVVAVVVGVGGGWPPVATWALIGWILVGLGVFSVLFLARAAAAAALALREGSCVQLTGSVLLVLTEDSEGENHHLEVPGHRFSIAATTFETLRTQLGAEVETERTWRFPNNHVTEYSAWATVVFPAGAWGTGTVVLDVWDQTGRLVHRHPSYAECLAAHGTAQNTGGEVHTSRGIPFHPEG